MHQRATGNSSQSCPSLGGRGRLSRGKHAFVATTCVIISGLWPTSALAHSWYPEECCSHRDCMPADSMITDARGDLLVTVGNRNVWVPRGFHARPSPDGRIHICFHEDDYSFTMPLCLFVPAQS